MPRIARMVLEDDLILTVAGTSSAGNDWDLVLDNTDFTAIRWRPVRDWQTRSGPAGRGRCH